MFVVYSNEAKTPFFEAHKLQIMGKFTIIKTQYEKETIVEKNTKYNYKVKLKIQADDIWDPINMEYIKNWIQKQRKKDYGTVNKLI